MINNGAAVSAWIETGRPVRDDDRSAERGAAPPETCGTRPAHHGVRTALRRRTTSTTEPAPIASARCTAALTGTR